MLCASHSRISRTDNQPHPGIVAGNGGQMLLKGSDSRLAKPLRSWRDRR